MSFAIFTIGNDTFIGDSVTPLLLFFGAGFSVGPLNGWPLYHLKAISRALLVGEVSWALEEGGIAGLKLCVGFLPELHSAKTGTRFRRCTSRVGDAVLRYSERQLAQHSTLATHGQWSLLPIIQPTPLLSLRHCFYCDPLVATCARKRTKRNQLDRLASNRFQAENSSGNCQKCLVKTERL